MEASLALEKRFEKVEYMNVYGTDSQKVIVEGEILLPEIKPDAVKVLQTDSEILITNVEVLNDKVIVQGEIEFRVIYLSSDPQRKVASVSSSAEFSKTFDMLGVRPTMAYEVKDDLIYTFCSLLSPRKLSAKAIAEITVLVKAPATVEYLADIEEDSIKYLKEKISISNPRSTTEEISKREILEIPQGKPSIREILRCFARLSDRNIKFDRKKMTFDLKVDLKTLYSPDIGQNPIEMVEHEVLIQHTAEVPDSPDDVEPVVKFYIKSFKVLPKTDEIGELRRIEYDITIEAEITFHDVKTIEPIVDAYSTAYEIKDSKKLLNIEQFVGKVRHMHLLKDTIALPIEPEQVFSVSGRIEVDVIKPEKNKINIKGVAVVFLIYLSKDQQDIIKNTTSQIPFDVKLDIEGVEETDRAFANIEIENISFSIISTSEVELRIHLAIEAWIKRALSKEILSDLELVEEIKKEEERLASVYIYTVQKGDTLWKIAKKYRTTVEKMVDFNQIDKEEIVPGQKLLIVK
ncbi:DUF3794 domain-containing protein [Caldicellulosiruptor acetigenus]|uniref:DUF3794 and LysM peptidoglycan-binding domain-containing protein n=1 Tax=Caldicellulosiruptor acetigenus TaxID=301953 RepID=UPI00040318FF|nr:SPOCS domain-containing protein [Caldicellulosiruptor acetigenus]WAM36650.1 DUF3794 domain-containing protein [Caldicellulosiruptor acetigenus]